MQMKKHNTSDYPENFVELFSAIILQNNYDNT